MWFKDFFDLVYQNKPEILEFLAFKKSVRRQFADVSTPRVWTRDHDLVLSRLFP